MSNKLSADLCKSKQDLIAEEVVEAEAPAVPLPSFPAGTFRPGRVVWAKVEGHEWWPAKVVRRRAVPRDVAEPPGGKAYVRLFIPVIFFTAQGIPGELISFEDRLDAALAASAHSGISLSFANLFRICQLQFISLLL